MMSQYTHIIDGVSTQKWLFQVMVPKAVLVEYTAALEDCEEVIGVCQRLLEEETNGNEMSSPGAPL